MTKDQCIAIVAAILYPRTGSYTSAVSLALRVVAEADDRSWEDVTDEVRTTRAAAERSEP